MTASYVVHPVTLRPMPTARVLNGGVAQLDARALVPTALGAATIGTPANPTDGSALYVEDADGFADVNSITLSGTAGALIDGAASVVLSRVNGQTPFVFDSGQWRRLVSRRSFGSADAPLQRYADLSIGTTMAGTCTLEQFGAVGDGVTSDQAAFAAAIAAIAAGTYRTLLLGAKTYLVTAGISMPSLGNIIGVGESSVLKTATAAPIIKVNNVNDILLQNFRMVGTTVAGQYGIACGTVTLGVERLRIDGVSAETLYRGLSFELNNGGHNGPQVSNCRIRSCAYGIYIASGSEFISFSNCQVHENSTGVSIAAGNIFFAGGTINYNVIGVELLVGSNDAHGLFTGVGFNHNSSAAVTVGAITNGHRFTGCNFYQGDIVLNGNTGAVIFTGCHLDPTNLTFTNSLAKFSNCSLSSTYFAAYTDTGTADTDWESCRHINGTIPTFIGQRTHQRYTFPGDANQALSAQVSRAEVLDVQAGVITAGRTLTSTRPPNQGGRLLLKNRTAQIVTYAWATGTGIAVAAGAAALIGADGVNAVLLQ